MLTCSIPIMWRLVSGIAQNGATRVQPLRRSIAIEPMWTSSDGLFGGLDGEALDTWSPAVELGLHHEQQHQELLLTDLKYNFACNPLRPAYVTTNIPCRAQTVSALQWVSFPEGVYRIGHDGPGFCL